MNDYGILKHLENERILTTWTGGLDSTSAILFLMKELNCKILPYFINRGQGNYEKERKAIDSFFEILKKSFPNNIEDLVEIEVNIPPEFFKKHYRGNKSIYVLRNSDILNQGIRLALCKQIKFICTGSNYDDNFEDNSIHFYSLMNEMIKVVLPDKNVKIIAPFQEMKWGKTDMVVWAKRNNFDLRQTWSCWYNEDNQCGNCPPCKRRNKAFEEAEDFRVENI